jgi:serine/threonine-protein kinase
VADSKSNKIRKITPDGILSRTLTHFEISLGTVSTIAGSGRRGGLDGKSSEATFSYPVGIAVSDKGEIFVADALNHKIRKIVDGIKYKFSRKSFEYPKKSITNSNIGMVSTVAGKERGFLDGNVDCAAFNKPKGVAIDDTDGSLVVADCENHRIRKIDIKKGIYVITNTLSLLLLSL